MDEIARVADLLYNNHLPGRRRAYGGWKINPDSVETTGQYDDLSETIRVHTVVGQRGDQREQPHMRYTACLNLATGFL